MASKTSVLINIAYALASAAYCIMHDVDRRLQAEEGAHLRQDKRRKFSQLMADMKAIKIREERIDEDVFEALAGEYRDYEYWQQDYNEICRLMLLWIDRCDNDDDAKNSIFKALRELPTTGIFEESDIDRFRLKKI